MQRTITLLLALSVVSLLRAQTSTTPTNGDKSNAVQPVVIGTRVGGPVTPPVLIHSVDPQYSEQARAAHVSGTVKVYLWVDEKGSPSHVRVVSGVGMGLDEKAVEAIRQYKFKPATQNGKPVRCDLYIDVNFSFHGNPPSRDPND